MDRFESTVAPGGSWERRHEFRRAVPDDRVRVASLLYRGESSEAPTRANADREGNLWIAVSG